LELFSPFFLPRIRERERKRERERNNDIHRRWRERERESLLFFTHSVTVRWLALFGVWHIPLSLSLSLSPSPSLPLSPDCSVLD